PVEAGIHLDLRGSSPVIGGARFGIGEDVVRLSDPLESLLRRLVSGIPVGVVFRRESPEGAPDVLGRGVARHPEFRVVVALRHDYGTRLSSTRRTPSSYDDRTSSTSQGRSTARTRIPRSISWCR